MAIFLLAADGAGFWLIIPMCRLIAIPGWYWRYNLIGVFVIPSLGVHLPLINIKALGTPVAIMAFLSFFSALNWWALCLAIYFAPFGLTYLLGKLRDPFELGKKKRPDISGRFFYCNCRSVYRLASRISPNS
ncbi:hypothetical protein PSDVSF_33370 [Pseudodesulfovibrio sediminis]|uniref:Uncharacterized protein n=1 Tax=Pseudodesulfovibrio sediminis TaxID=2810563 RepID=A0ABN6EY12_9BACT|nr:hypothetical protein PSDVSF_33370 [Pseudodesulfovibrio sediminis]